jgi:hypothetical protein
MAPTLTPSMTASFSTNRLSASKSLNFARMPMVA